MQENFITLDNQPIDLRHGETRNGEQGKAKPNVTNEAIIFLVKSILTLFWLLMTSFF